MISINIMGGLGNQLFQIAAIIAYCMEHKKDFILPYKETQATGPERPTYWDNMLVSLTPCTTKAHPNINNEGLYQWMRFDEEGFHYSPIPPMLENTLLWGYFQSYKYFHSFRKQVLAKMGVDVMRKDIYNEFQERLPIDGPCISIHFRLGDYKEKQEYHPILPYEYYDRALQQIPVEDLAVSNVLYFCEEEDREHVDNIMSKLYTKYKLSFLPICVDHKIPDWKQLLIMSHCRINIIANSSYSWWAAYLNDDPHKRVLYPDTWFGPALHYCKTQDLCPEDWIRVECKD